MQAIDVEVKPDHLERISSVARPVDAVAELIWNGLDADASQVRVDLDTSPLGGLTAIRVTDNGRGIAYDEAPTLFRNLGGSWKQQKRRSPDGRMLHGKAGSGRFRAFALGGHVEWLTTCPASDGAVSYRITGRADVPNRFHIDDPRPERRGHSGTQVTVSNLAKNYRSLDGEKARQALTEEFALYLREYPSVSIVYDGVPVDPASIQRRFERIAVPPVQIDDERTVTAELVIIEWVRPMDRTLALCDENGFALAHTQPGIQAPGYQFTAYLKSAYLSELSKNGTIDLVDLHPGLRKLLEAAKGKLREYFRLRAVEGARDIVDGWKRENVYPYQDPPKDALEETERQVFDVVALNVNSYLPDFERSDPRNKRFSFQLLRQAIEQSPAAVQRILSDVIGLPREKQEELAELLERTTLTAIINATKLVTSRLDMLRGLEILLFDTKDELLERRELHRILAENTWIFGEEYNLSVDDQSLSEVLRKHLHLLGRTEDSEPVLRPDGTTGIVDLMLSRSIPQPRADEREHLVVELKRPLQAINAKVATQVESYAFAVAQDERFRDTSTRWVFWAVSNEMDDHVRRRARQKDRPQGLIHQDEESRITVWAKTWSQVLQQCRARLEFFRGALEYTVDRDRSLEYLRKTHEKYLPKSLRAPSDGDASEDFANKTAAAETQGTV